MEALAEVIAESKIDDVLRLNNRQIINLPNTFVEYANVKRLLLSMNTLKSLPDQFISLSRLEELDLSFNSFDHIPSVVISLSGLRLLKMNGNYLKEFDLSSLGKLPHLQNLDISHCEIVSLPSNIGNMISLVSLLANGNSISKIPSSISSLTNLTNLSLYGNKIHEIGVELSKLTKLKFLSIDSNPLGQIPKEVRVSLKHTHIEASLPDEVIKGLFIGDWSAAANKLALKANNISHILMCGYMKKAQSQDEFNYLTIEIEDSGEENISKYFSKSHEFISCAINENNGVLVHCAAGISRSATIVICFLMKANKISYRSALDIVKNARPIVQPNRGFVEQLLEYEKQCFI